MTTIVAPPQDGTSRASGAGATLRWRAPALGIAAVLVFLALTTRRLGAQGLYADEVHQVDAAFFWTGKHPVLAVSFNLGRMPVLNMPYSGAMKSAVYGLWMKLTHASFSVISWRLLGIFFAAAGVGWLVAAAARSLGVGAALLLASSLVADPGLLVMSRHDWGPVALSFMFRAVLIAAWLRAETSEVPRPLHAFSMGLATQLAIFEKLSSIVLVVPLVLAFVTSARLRERKQVLAAVRGFLIGALPLAIINTASLLRYHRLVSLDAVESPPLTLASARWLLSSYVTQAAGEGPLDFVLGLAPLPHVRAASTLGLCIAMGALMIAGAWPGRRLARLAAVLALSWLAVGLGLCLLPKVTWAHHWILGTPFQYAALATGVAAWLAPPGPAATRGERFLTAGTRLALGIGAALLLASSVSATVEVEHALADGRYAERFSPELTAAAEAAAAEGPQTIFVAANWGIALQINSMANGRDGFVAERNWRDGGVAVLEKLLRAPGLRRLYVVARVPENGPLAPEEERVFTDAAALPGWKQAPVPVKFAGLHRLRFARYERLPLE
jgi:hypothetical protein